MARDNHPRIRRIENLRRRTARLQPAERVLIICEGKKTEPKYLQDVQREARASSASVAITHSPYGTTPMKIVEFAKDKFLETHAFDKVFTVFDRDDHEDFDKAIDLTDSLNNAYKNDYGKRVPFSCITSIPCFEIWFLLHFERVMHNIHRDEVLTRLKTHISDYEKGGDNYRQRLRPQQDEALKNLEILRRECTQNGDVSIGTSIPELIDLISTLRITRN